MDFSIFYEILDNNFSGIKTQTQKNIIEILFYSDFLSARDIKELFLMKFKMKISICTIYKNLSYLKNLRIISSFRLEGVQKFWLSTRAQNVLICQRCGKYNIFNDNEVDMLLNNLGERYKFVIDEVKFILTGICASCLEE